MKISWKVENNDPLDAIRRFLQKLLTERVVEALLVPMRTPHGAIAPALVSDPALLAHADPLAPVMPVNAATLVGHLSARQPRPKVGAVLRSCEARALVELVKLQQASLDDLLLIAVDCAGTVAIRDFQKQAGLGSAESASAALWQALFSAALERPEAPLEMLRPACQICEQPVYDRAQVVIELFNSRLEQAIVITLPDDLGARLGLAATDAGGDRAAVIEKLRAARTIRRDEEFAAIRARLEGEERLTGVFAACIRCHNCMTVCPLCYCKTCVFKSQVFDHEPMQYLTWAKQKGAFRMPADTSLFHLTRLNHMALSCVGCGMCSQACPADLPVGTVFRAIGQRVQETFRYRPGMDPEEKLPLTTFKPDEWSQVGE